MRPGMARDMLGADRRLADCTRRVRSGDGSREEVPSSWARSTRDGSIPVALLLFWLTSCWCYWFCEPALLARPLAAAAVCCGAVALRWTIGDGLRLLAVPPGQGRGR
jgi:hypothetical protein